MLPKCTVLFLVIVAVKSATLQGKNIPVEVRYERLKQTADLNLKEKIQLSEDETKENKLRLEKLSINKEALGTMPIKDHQNSIRNFDEKIQLSPEELLQSSKHIFTHHSIKDGEKSNLDVSGELRGKPVIEIKSDNPSKAIFIQQAQDIIEKGIESLKDNFHPNETEKVPTKELWEKLESDVKKYLIQENTHSGLRQQGTNPQNIFQNIANGFQQITNNFIQQFQNQNQSNNNGTAGDEGQAQGPIQGFVGYFTGDDQKDAKDSEFEKGEEIEDNTEKQSEEIIYIETFENESNSLTLPIIDEPLTSPYASEKPSAKEIDKSDQRSQITWKEWTPKTLKRPVSKSLKVTRKEKQAMTKLQASQKINTLAELKKKLIDLQIQYLKKDMENIEQQHELKFKKAEEDLKCSKLDVEIKELEKNIKIETLKKILNNNFNLP